MAVAEHRDRECVVLPDATLTYAEVDRLANATANMLLDRGVGEGSVVMTLCDNGAAQVATWFACMKIGAVFAPLNAGLTGDPLTHVMARAGGRLLVCDAALAGPARAAAADLSTLTTRLIVGANGSSGFASFDRAVDDAGTEPPSPPPANPGAPARLMFTSGTTGESKGVLWSRNAETLHAVAYGDELVRTDPGETVYTCLPLFHVTAQGTFLGTLLRADARSSTGGSTHCASGREPGLSMPCSFRTRARSSAPSCPGPRVRTTRTTRCVARWAARRRRVSGRHSSAASA
jgi:crotonobetaine/carnitine-CoA ligase